MKTPVFAQSVQNLCNIDVLSESTTSSNTSIGTENLLLRAHNSTYHLHALDLRDITRRGRHRHQVEQDFNQMGVSLNIPTLILSECCLIYLPPEDADSVLPYFTEAFQPVTSIGVIIYEPIRPHDAFGRTMVSNLTARGIHLQTLNAHDSLATQKERLRKHGLGSTEGSEAQGAAAGGAEAADIDFIWQAWIKESEKERVENLEWMDEVEEWRLLARHYCVAWGWKEGSDQVKGSVFDTWTRLPVQDEG
jgi:[phosphatase 2A protein]-leucine-carboxy methyltransferase